MLVTQLPVHVAPPRVDRTTDGQQQGVEATTAYLHVATGKWKYCVVQTPHVIRICAWVNKMMCRATFCYMSLPHQRLVHVHKWL